MANETSYALISSLLPSIYEAALMYAQENFVMPMLVTVHSDHNGMQDRIYSKYAGGTVVTGLGETTDLTTQAFTRASLVTLTPAEIGTQFVVTDRRMDSDDVDVMTDLSQHIGYTVFKQVEAHLAATFSSLTAGTIGSAGSAMSWTTLYQARSVLAAGAIPPPYNVVLHEYQWLDLALAANIAGAATSGPMRFRDDIQSRYYVASVGDMDIYTTGTEVISAGTAVYGGIFSRRAIALDIRRALRIELERNASLRSTEVNATMIYAHGVLDATYGAAILSDGSAP